MLLSLVGSTVQQPVKRLGGEGGGGVEGLALLLRLHKGVRVPHSLGTRIANSFQATWQSATRSCQLI